MDYKKIKLNSSQGKKILSSHSYRENLKNIAYGMAGDRVKLSFFSSGTQLGYSDGKTIFVNLFPQMFSEETLDVILTYHIALIVHEYSHVLYSDFKAIKEAAKKPLLKHIFNVLEDSRIERISSFKLPGYAMSLYCLNKALYSDKEPENELEFLLHSIWDYALLGINPATIPEKCSDDWYKIKKFVKEARLNDECLECYEICKRIYYILEKYLDDSSYEQPQQAIGDFEGDCDGQNGDTNGQDNRSGNQTNEQSAENGSSGSNGKPKTTDGSQDSSNQFDSAADSDVKSKGHGSDGHSAEQKGVIIEDDSLKEKLKEFLSALAETLETTIDDYKQEEANAIFDRQLANEMKNCGVSSNFSVDDSQIELYNLIKADSSGIISNMKRKLYNVIRFNDDEVTRRQTRGRIDSKSLTNIINGRICRTFKEKSEETDLNVTLLIDASGSMQGMREQETLRATVVMQEALEMLKIPFSTVEFENIATVLNIWNQKSKLKKYSVMNYRASGGTHLYQAFDAVERFFRKQQSYDKVVLVITDGEPAMMHDTADRIMMIRSKYNAQIYGIGIGADILPTASGFLQLFGAEFFIRVDKLNELPLEMAKILKRNLLRTGD